MTRSLFLRGLAVIYLIAFASLLPQVSGLIGSHGILPAHDYLENIHSEYGASGYALFPTLAWLNASDVFLRAMVWAGIALAILLLIGLGPLPAAIGLYALYLSVDTVGQAFYSFQWDALLLEVGFAAILLAPRGVRPSYKDPPSRVAVWVFRLLIFRLMLESGSVKLLSGDPTWRNLTALNYHYWTQPLPTPMAWYAQQLPSLLQRASVLGVFAAELLVPFLFLTTARLRRIGAVITIVFQLMIAATGNYTFFNLLTILLCVLLFDVRPAARTPWNALFVGAVLIAVGFLQLGTTFGIPKNLPEPFSSMDFRAETFHIVNHYGLFAVMTTSRLEIVIEGSDDGVPAPAMGRALSATTGLANVVCRPFELPEQWMVPATHIAIARGNSGGNSASRLESIFWKTAALHSCAYLRLSLHRLAHTPQYRRHLDAHRGWTIFSGGELEAVGLFLQQGL
jgi:hypothetical protein